MVKLIATVIGFLFLASLLIDAAVNWYEPSAHISNGFPLTVIRFFILYIHEAGHFIFGFFGHTLRILGGSLNEVLAPLAWFIIAKRDGSRLADVGLFFTGLCLVDVSLYIKDAGRLVLPLIGGLSKTHHDWANLMNEWDMIPESYGIGEFIYWLGVLVGTAAIVHGIITAVRVSREAPAAVD